MTYNFVIAIRNKIPVLVSGPKNIVTDNTDYTLELITDGEWDEFPKKTVYYAAETGNAVYHIVDGDKDNIPMQTKAGRLYIGISAGDLHTSRDVSIPVTASVRRRAGTQMPEPEADVYDQIMGDLNDHEKRIGKLEKGGGGSGSGTWFEPGNALELTEDFILNVRTTNDAEEDNTLPITSAGVNTIVGNIGAILDTI